MAAMERGVNAEVSVNMEESVDRRALISSFKINLFHPRLFRTDFCENLERSTECGDDCHVDKSLYSYGDGDN